MLDKIEEAIEAIKNGEIIIVVDDEDRENEGDFICAAEKCTPEVINFMAKEGRGLICAALVKLSVSDRSLKTFRLCICISQSPFSGLHGSFSIRGLMCFITSVS